MILKYVVFSFSGSGYAQRNMDFIIYIYIYLFSLTDKIGSFRISICLFLHKVSELGADEGTASVAGVHVQPGARLLGHTVGRYKFQG